MFLVRGASPLCSGRAAEVIRRMQLTNEKQRSGTVTLPLNGLTGRPFTMDVAGYISGLNAALSRQADTGRQIPYTDMLRQEAHFSAMLDGAVDKDSDLFDALYHVLNDSKGAVSLVTLLSAARRIAGTDVSNKKPDGTARLEALFRFLSRSRYSPLLKGAVAHAFILATQPFIVGNGRIARFLNFTILAQGGFRFHHSLSEIIAGHSQEYIQAVRGLFLPSNAGSLTAFVGFILKMTADAIETAPEDKVRPVPDNSHDSEEALPAGETGKADVAAIPLSKTGDAVLPETALKSVGPISDNSPIWAKLSIMENGRSAHVKRTAIVVGDMLRAGILEFTRREWAEHSGMSYGEFKVSLQSLHYYGIIEKAGTEKHGTVIIYVYRFTVDTPLDGRHAFKNKSVIPPQQNDSVEPLPPAEPAAETAAPTHWPVLDEMRNSRFETGRKTADAVEGFLRDGVLEFDYALWLKRTGMTYREFDQCRKSLTKRRLITNLTPGLGNTAHYRLCVPADSDSDQGGDSLPILSKDHFWAIIEDMECSRSLRIRQTADIVRAMIDAGISEFTRTEWIGFSGMSVMDFTGCRMALMTKRIIAKVQNRGNDDLTLYRFMLEGISPGTRPDVQSRPAISLLDADSFQEQLNDMCRSRSKAIRGAVAAITEMINEGTLEFTRDAWMERTGMTKQETNTCFSSLATRNMVVRIGSSSNSVGHALSLYRLTWPADSGVSISPSCLRTEPENYHVLLEKIAPLSPVANLPDKIITLLNRTRRCFRAEEWASVNSLPIEETEFEMNVLIQMGLVFRQTVRGSSTYQFRFHNTDTLAQLIENEIHAPRLPDNYDFWTNLALLEFSHSSVIRRGAREFLKLIEDGRSRFSPAYFRQYAKMSDGECRNIIRALLDKKLVTATGGITRTRRYDIAPIAFEGRG